MKENLMKVLKFILQLSTLTILLPIVILVKITSNSRNIDKEYYIEWTEKMINGLLPMICKFIDIEDVPIIYIQKEISIFNDPLVFGQFVHSSSIFDFNEDTLGVTKFNNNVVNINNNCNGVHNRMFVMINIININKIVLSHRFITKIMIIMTLVHELTHYRQYINGALTENYINYEDDITAYKKQDVEIEANRNGTIFVLMNALSIIKFIFKNK